MIELESALLDDCNVNDIYSICRGKAIPESLRPDVWQICLDVRYKSDQMALFNEIFDLPFQTELRNDCNTFVDKLGNDEEDKVSVVSDLESILTFYCKNRSMQYATKNGWIELLLPLLSLKLSRSYTYNLFEAIRDTYIPKGCVKNGNVFHVFRLLILYHDPELCSMLDTKKITPDQYSMSWFQSLFAATCTFPVVLNMWDLYFQQTDPFLVFFLSLIMLINGRDQILAMRDQPREHIVNFLSNMPCALESDDVVDFCSLAQYYSMKTPSSFKTDYLKSLFGADVKSTSNSVISQALCLPVSVYELIENVSTASANADSVRFFLVDCRPAEQYNYGHLPTAFHLDSNLMLQEPMAFATAVNGLLRAQKLAIEANSNAGGEHLCFMGSGRLDEDQYMHMVVASFLQKNTQYVSLLTGGYTAIHDYFGCHMSDCLEDHNVNRCLMCISNDPTKSNPDNNSIASNVNRLNKTESTATVASTSNSLKSQPSIDLFSKLSAAMKTKSAEVKGKFFDYIVNPSSATAQATGTGNGVASERHVSSNEKYGRRYRNVAPVFSIDDDNHDIDVHHQSTADLDEMENRIETVNVAAYVKGSDVIATYKCQEVQMNGSMYESHLIVTETHLVVLRDMEKKGMAQILVRRPLQNIVKITAKKRHQNLITFKYGVPDGDEVIITDMDRFLIPNAKEATALVSRQILNLLDNTTDDK